VYKDKNTSTSLKTALRFLRLIIYETKKTVLEYHGNFNLSFWTIFIDKLIKINV